MNDDRYFSYALEFRDTHTEYDIMIVKITKTIQLPCFNLLQDVRLELP